MSAHPPTRPGPIPPQDRLGDNLGMRILLPVGRSPWAIAAGYAGLFAVLLIPAPAALILGFVAIRDIKRHPGKHGLGRAIFGVVMGLLFTVGLVVVVAKNIGAA